MHPLLVRSHLTMNWMMMTFGPTSMLRMRRLERSHRHHKGRRFNHHNHKTHGLPWMPFPLGWIAWPLAWRAMKPRGAHSEHGSTLRFPLPWLLVSQSTIIQVHFTRHLWGRWWWDLDILCNSFPCTYMAVLRWQRRKVKVSYGHVLGDWAHVLGDYKS